MGYVYIIKYLMENGFALNLNIVNFISCLPELFSTEHQDDI